MRGDIELMGVSPVPPLGKALYCDKKFDYLFLFLIESQSLRSRRSIDRSKHALNQPIILKALIKRASSSLANI